MGFKGFTLIELIIILVIIGVLSVSAYPLLSGSQSYSSRAYQTQLVNFLQLQQQRAMQDTQGEYCVLFDGNRFGVPNNCEDSALPNNFENSYEGVSINDGYEGSIDLIPEFNKLYFNSLGCPVDSPGQECPGSSIQVTYIESATSQQVCIEPQGYIHEGACRE